MSGGETPSHNGICRARVSPRQILVLAICRNFPTTARRSGLGREFGTRQLLIDDYVAASGTKLQTRGDDPDVLLCLLFSRT
jgi:hypothetical protein